MWCQIRWKKFHFAILNWSITICLISQEYFWDYAKKTVFYEKLKKFKQEYSEEKKQSDTEAFERLLKKAEIIPDTEITFKKVYESGVSVRLW